MKKKLVAIVLVTILLATILSGCTLFVKNEERDYKQVLATVSSRGITSNITKGEFLDYYSQTAPVYMQYYGWTASMCVNQFMNALAKKELLLIEARAYFSSKQSKDIGVSVMDLLSESEQAWVIRRTNKTFQDALDTNIKQVVADDKANSGVEDEEDDEDTTTTLPSPKPEKPTVDEDEKYKDSMTTTKDDYFFDAIGKKTLTATEKKALAKLEKSLKDQYKDYNFYLDQQAESRLLDKYKDEVKGGNVEGYKVEVTDAEVQAKYKLLVNQQKYTAMSDASYKTALEGDTTLIYHNGKYVKVKSILLSFTEKQTGLLSAFKEFYKGYTNSEEMIAKFRDMLVFGETEGSNVPFGVEKKHLQLLVHVGNLDYKADSQCTATKGTCTCVACPNSAGYDEKNKKKCEIVLENKETNEFILNVPGCTCSACDNHAYEMYNVPFEDVLKQIATAVEKAGDDAAANYFTKYPNGNEQGKALYIAQERMKEFENWIFKVNGDDGMFEGKDYIGTPEGKTSEYVKEYTALLRALIDDKATAGTMETTADSYTVEGKQMTIRSTVDEHGNKISYVVNDFGVHIVMITDVPVDEVNNSADKITSYKEGDNTYYILGIDAVVGFDSDTGLAVTVFDELKKSMKEQKETDLYNKFEKSITGKYGKYFFNKDNKDTFTLNRKVFDEIIKWSGAEKSEIEF